MNFRDLIDLALRNLRQAKLRTTLTALGVSIGIASLVGMVSLGVGLQEQFTGRFMKSGLFDAVTVLPGRPPGRPISVRVFSGRPGPGAQPGPGAAGTPGNAGQEKVLDDAIIQEVASWKNVKEVYPNLRIPVQVRYEDFAEYTAASSVPMSSRGEGAFQKISHGDFFPNDTAATCMLGLQFAKRIQEKDPQNLIGKEITLVYATSTSTSEAGPMESIGGFQIRRTEARFKVVGIIEREPGLNMGAAGISAVMIPLGKAKEIGSAAGLGDPRALLNQRPGRRSYESLSVRVRRAQDTEEVEKKIRDLGFNAFSIADLLQGMKRVFIILDLILSLVGSIALIVASLGIVNTMVMSILERTREIGIMKAIGGSDGDVQRIFLVEASVIGMMGGVFGILFGWCVGRAINFGANIYIERQGGPAGNLFSIPWWLVLGGIGFSIVVSLIAGSYPAARAAHLDPIQALRHD